MTLQTLSGGLVVPRRWARSGATTFSNASLNGDGEKYALVCQAPKSGNIDRIEFRAGSVTTSGDVDCRVETVSTSDGNPSGSLFGGGSQNGTVNVNTANTWYGADLTDDAVVTVGDLIALVLVIAGTTSIQISGASSAMDWLGGHSFPYTAQFDAGAWSKSTNDAPTLCLRYSDGTYPSIGSFAVTGVNSTSFSSASTPDERALKFTLPFPARIIGCYVSCDFVGDTTLRLYDADANTVLTSIAIDKDQQMTTSPGLRRYLFPAAQTLAKDTAYRLSVLPGATAVVLQELTVNSAALLDAIEGGGQNFCLTTRTDGATTGGGESNGWTTTTTTRPLIHLILDQFDDGASGGSGGGLKLVGTGGLVG